MLTSLRAPLLLAAALAAGLTALPLLAPHNITLLNLGFLTFLYVAQGVGWNILGGFAGYISFGYAAFYGLGAYTTALLWLAGPPPRHIPRPASPPRCFRSLWAFPRCASWGRTSPSPRSASARRCGSS